MSTNPNDAAFPFMPKTNLGEYSVGVLGLTKREYFAAQALRGVCEWDAIANEHRLESAGNIPNIACACIGLADALIAELNKTGDQK